MASDSPDTPPVPRPEVVAWQDVLEGLLDGRYTILPGVIRTDERGLTVYPIARTGTVESIGLWVPFPALDEHWKQTVHGTIPFPAAPPGA